MLPPCLLALLFGGPPLPPPVRDPCAMPAYSYEVRFVAFSGRDADGPPPPAAVPSDPRLTDAEIRELARAAGFRSGERAEWGYLAIARPGRTEATEGTVPGSPNGPRFSLTGTAPPEPGGTHRVLLSAPDVLPDPVARELSDGATAATWIRVGRGRWTLALVTFSNCRQIAGREFTPYRVVPTRRQQTRPCDPPRDATLQLQVVVDERGRPGDFLVIEGDACLVPHAIASVARWQFEPPPGPVPFQVRVEVGVTRPETREVPGYVPAPGPS